MREKVNALAKLEICDECFGRQFGFLLSGLTNSERGRALRLFALMESQEKQNGEVFFIPDDYVISARKGITVRKFSECKICRNFFKRCRGVALRAVKAASQYEYSSFCFSAKIDRKLIELEREIGVTGAEDFSDNVTREVGKLFEALTGKRFDPLKSDLTICVSVPEGEVAAEARDIHIYGEYQKKVRGIPQSKWDKYAESVHSIIDPFIIEAFKAKSTKFHAMGREDVDVRCLGWRPFIMTIKDAKKRSVDLSTVNIDTEKVAVRGLRPATRADVALVKSDRREKVYDAIVKFEAPVSQEALAKLPQDTIMLNQRTPSRVQHRRADLVRNRRIKILNITRLSETEVRITLRSDSGTYIKEFISGDNGRTEPSITSIVGIPASCYQLDVIDIPADRQIS